MALITDESSKEFRALCRAYNYDNLPEIYADFVARFVDSDLTTSATLPQREFQYENIIGSMVNKRVTNVQTNVTIESTLPEEDDADPATDEERLKDVEAWNEYFFNQENINGETLDVALIEIVREYEIGGAAILTPTIDDEGVVKWVMQTNVDYVKVTDPSNMLEVGSWIFNYDLTVTDENETEQNKELKTVYDIDGFVQTLDSIEVGSGTINATDLDDNPILSVVSFEGEKTTNGEYARPGVAAMIEPQRNLNQALTQRAEINKLAAFPIYCPGDKDGEGRKVDDNIKLRPGSYWPNYIKKVEGSTAPESVEQAIMDYRDNIRVIGLFVDRNELSGVRATGADSGKAKVIQSAGMKNYVKHVNKVLQRGIYLMMVITASLMDSLDAENVKVVMPPVDTEDPDTAINRATVAFNNDQPLQATQILYDVDIKTAREILIEEANLQSEINAIGDNDTLEEDNEEALIG
jgi:hypothetical protein